MRITSGRTRGFFRNTDFWLAIFTFAAAVFGIIMISGAGGENSMRYVIVQSVALLLGIVGISALMILDYEYLAGISGYLCVGGVLLLVLVLIPGLGKVENGARSWFEFGPISLQPAEISKIIYIIVLAKLLSENEVRINEIRTIGKLVLCGAVPVVLILVQPDFGTAAVYMFIFAAMIFVAGIARKYLIGGAAVLTVMCPVAWIFFLQDYQKQRILTVLNPESDPSGAGYHVIQSKLAVGSGRILGSGLYKGSSQLNNALPERHTDFIYSAVCEELGLVGAVIVIALICAIILRCIYIGMNARNPLGTYMCTGVAAMLIFQSFENIGMCLGIFPVTGITLPFFSYGGSSLLTTLLAIGIVMNVKYRSRMINF